VVASNDGTAGGAVAALTAQGMEGIPVSGQDGDHAALNRVAKGTQTVSGLERRARPRQALPAKSPWLAGGTSHG
jgi:D-xylose transport system substrate-binding protein